MLEWGGWAAAAAGHLVPMTTERRAAAPAGFKIFAEEGV